MANLVFNQVWISKNEGSNDLCRHLIRYRDNESNRINFDEIVEKENITIPEGLNPNGYIINLHNLEETLYIEFYTKNNPSFWVLEEMVNKYSEGSTISFISREPLEGICDTNIDSLLKFYDVNLNITTEDGTKYAINNRCCEEYEVRNLCREFDIDSESIDDYISQFVSLIKKLGGTVSVTKFEKMDLSDYR